MEEAADAFFLHDREGRIRDVNRRACESLGYTRQELLALCVTDVDAEVDLAEARMAWTRVEPGRPVSISSHQRRKDGTVFPVEVSVGCIDRGGERLYMGLARDVSEARALRDKVARASHLAAMGTLVSGVAHEINSPLSSELCEIEFALAKTRQVKDRMQDGHRTDPDGDRRELDAAIDALEGARAAARRIGDVVRDLAALGQARVATRRARLVDVVRDAMRWVPAGYRTGVEVEAPAEGTQDVLVAPGQIAQVVVNLVTNAAKATPDGEIARVRVRIGPGSAGFVRLEVSDAGVGMDAATLGRIFEPFFTTRAPGSGTGLGLAICQAIVSAHGGAITAESEVGKGSTFRVDLPAAPDEG